MRNADQHSGISFWLTVFTGGAPPAKVALTFRNRTVDMNCAFIVHSVTLYNCPFGWTRIGTFRVVSRTGKRDGSGENGDERDQDKRFLHLKYPPFIEP